MTSLYEGTLRLKRFNSIFKKPIAISKVLALLIFQTKFLEPGLVWGLFPLGPGLVNYLTLGIQRAKRAPK